MNSHASKRSGAEQLQAIVLAGGYGNRLRPLVADVPKTMAPVGGRPFLSYVFDDLAEHGFHVVVVAVSWLHEAIISAFGDQYRGVQLRYSIEPEPLGTGGAVRQAFSYISDDLAFVLNGDTLQRLPYASMLHLAERERSDVVVAVRAVADAARYGTVELQGTRITKFAEKGASGPGLINAGAYLVRRSVVEHPDLGRAFSFEHDVLLPGVHSGVLTACKIEGNFIDIGIPKDYVRAGEEIPRWFPKAN
jgi:D-glycero-alpha-D-manno-heptose 1-phosphate guanylyltransferase